MPLYRRIDRGLPNGITSNYSKAIVYDSKLLRVAGKRRDFMPKIQGLPNNFTARAAGGAEDNDFQLAVSRWILDQRES